MEKLKLPDSLRAKVDRMIGFGGGSTNSLPRSTPAKTPIIHTSGPDRYQNRPILRTSIVSPETAVIPYKEFKPMTEEEANAIVIDMSMNASMSELGGNERYLPKDKAESLREDPLIEVDISKKLDGGPAQRPLKNLKIQNVSTSSLSLFGYNFFSRRTATAGTTATATTPHTDRDSYAVLTASDGLTSRIAPDEADFTKIVMPGSQFEVKVPNAKVLGWNYTQSLTSINSAETNSEDNGGSHMFRVVLDDLDAAVKCGLNCGDYLTVKLVHPDDTRHETQASATRRFIKEVAIIQNFQKAMLRTASYLIFPKLVGIYYKDDVDDSFLTLPPAIVMSNISTSLTYFLRTYHSRHNEDLQSHPTWLSHFMLQLSSTLAEMHAVKIVHNGLTLDSFSVEMVDPITMGNKLGPPIYRLVLTNFDRAEWHTTGFTDPLAGYYGCLIDTDYGVQVRETSMHEMFFMSPEAANRLAVLTIEGVDPMLDAQLRRDPSRTSIANGWIRGWFAHSRKIDKSASKHPSAVNISPENNVPEDPSYNKSDVYSFGSLASLLMNSRYWYRVTPQRSKKQWVPDHQAFGLSCE